MIITSTDNKYIKEIKKLQTKKYRDSNNLFLVEGDHLVKEAKHEGYLKEVICLEGYDNYDVKSTIVSENVMNYLSLLSNCNVIGVVNKPNKSIKTNKIVMLDNIQDPGNLGTIIRSMVAFNFDTLIISKDSVDLYNEKVLRATQGMIFKLNIIIADLETIIPELKIEGYKIVGTNVVNGNDIKSLEKLDKLCIIMGNEGNGLKKSTSDLCDTFIYIKMNNACESLNVGVATSIILYELDK